MHSNALAHCSVLHPSQEGEDEEPLTEDDGTPKKPKYSRCTKFLLITCGVIFVFEMVGRARAVAHVRVCVTSCTH